MDKICIILEFLIIIIIILFLEYYDNYIIITIFSSFLFLNH